MNARREFAVVAPDLRLALLAPMLGLVAGIVGIALAAREEPRVWWATIAIAAAAALIAWSLRRRRVVLEGDRLSILGGLNSARVTVADLDLDAARVVDLDEVPTLRPGLKTFGTSMPGFHAGHFRLRDRGKAFVLLTGRRKVLLLPERGGRRLLLSLEQPQALLDALRAVAESGRRR